METDGEGGGGGGGEAERRGSSELGRLLAAIGSSEVLEKRIPLIKQLEDEFSADDLGLILQGLLASWVDSTCSGLSHCTLHRSILQVALKCSDLDIAGHLGQLFTLGAKASSWCAKHLQCSAKCRDLAKCIDQSQVGEEEEHNKLCQEVNILSLSISAKLLDIAAKCITLLGLEVAEGEEGQGAAQEECVLNKADDLYPTLETVGKTRMAPWGPSPQETSRGWCRCTHCASENTPRWYQGPDSPGMLCSSCWYLFKRGRLQHSNPDRPRGRPSKKHRPCMHCGSTKTPRWRRGPDGPGTLCSACGQRFLIGRLNKPRGRRGCPLNKPPSNKPRRCLHCRSEKTPRWLRGPDGPGTLCNACGQQFYKGRLLDSKSHRQRGRPSKERRSSSKEDKAAGTDVAALAEALPCNVDASLDAFFDHTGWEVLCGEAGADEEEEELEWLSNKDAFPSVETMAVEVEEEAPAPDVPRARTKGRRRVTAMETTRRQAEKETVRRCSHCATEKTPQWREGPEGPSTLCNACGLVFKNKGRLLPQYRPANSPAFSPLLHSNRSRRALRRNETSATGAMHVVRRCTRCATENTPHWREAPEGPCTLCNTCGMMFKRKGRLLPEYHPANSPAFSPLLQSNRSSRGLEMHRRNETSATGEMHVVLVDPPENGPTPSPLQRYNSLRCVVEEEISTAGHVAATEASRGEESMEVQPLPERPPVDSPAFSLVPHSRALKRRRKSEAQTFAAIRATAKAGRADRAAARLAAMDNR